MGDVILTTNLIKITSKRLIHLPNSKISESQPGLKMLYIVAHMNIYCILVTLVIVLILEGPKSV